MKENIVVTICGGTACYVLGGAEFFQLQEQLSEDLQSQVTIKASNCMGLCRDRANGKPPFVTVNGKVIQEATTEGIVREIVRLTGAEEGIDEAR